MSPRFFFRLCVLLAVSVLSHGQTTIHVPADQPTIQAGINAANTGDTVLVAPGTYTENIDFKGKAITVTSSGGAAVTTIDGGSKGGVATVRFQNGEQGSVIAGFTIRDGGEPLFEQTEHGGIYVNASAPVIRNNIITGNYCQNIAIVSGNATVTGNEISGVNQDSASAQGLSYCANRSGIYVSGGSTGVGSIISGNTIEKNLLGPGIYLSAQNTIITNNTIRGNSSSVPGSAISSQSSSGTVIFQNLIYGNTSTCGGALAFANSSYRAGVPAILIANNTIADNYTPKLSTVTNCAYISQLYPSPDRYGEDTPNSIIVNNIISGSTSYPAVNCSLYQQASESIQPTFQNNILYNAGGPFFGPNCIDVSGKYSNIAADPQFMSSATGDYHLKSTSPALDRGQTSLLQTLSALTGESLPLDLDGNPRVQDATGQGCVIDMGAYEFPGTKSICGTSETLTSSLNPSLYGQSVTLTAQLSSANGVPTGSIQFSDGATVLGAMPISASGIAALTTTQLAVGTHVLTATYQPDGTLPATSASLSQVVTAPPTATTLTSSSNPSTYLQPVTFAAHVVSSSSAAGTPTGTLTFLDGNTPLASIPVDNAGNATFTTATLAASPQAHIITAQFTPAGNFSSSTAQLSQLVNGLATSATLTVTPLAGQSTDTYTMVATVANTSGTLFGTPPSGTVSFYFNGYGASANYATLVNGVATLQATNLTPGQNTVTAVYHGDSAYAGSSSNPVVLTINGAPTSLTLSSSANPGIANTAFTITAHLTANGVAVPAGTALQLNLAGAQTVTLTTDANGLASYAATFPAPGTYLLSATFAGKNNLLPSTASYSEVLTGVPTATALTASPTPAYAGQAVTLIAASTSAGTPDAAGTITFYDGATALGTVPLSPTGQATLTTSTLAVGTHTLTASLAASGNVLGSSSAPVPLTVLPSTFGIVLSPANVSLQAGKTGTVAVNLSSIGAFAGPLTLSTGPMPPYATASFNTGSVTLTAAGSASVNLLLNTAQEATSQPPTRPGAKSWPLVFAASLALPLGLARRRRLRQTLAVFLLLAGLCGTLTGCGFIGVPFHLVPAGTYQIPVMATDANGNQHSATLTLTITP